MGLECAQEQRAGGFGVRSRAAKAERAGGERARAERADKLAAHVLVRPPIDHVEPGL